MLIKDYIDSNILPQEDKKMNRNKFCSWNFDDVFNFFPEEHSVDEILKTENGWTINIYLAGINKDSCEIFVENNILNVVCEFKKPNNTGTYKQQFSLRNVVNINREQITASYKYGILTINVPFKEKEEQETPKKQIISTNFLE